MNWKNDSSWTQIKNKIVPHWNKLTDEDIAKIDGKREQLVSAVQIQYSLTSEQAEAQVCAFESKYDSHAKESGSCCGSDKKVSTPQTDNNPRETTL